MSTSDSRKYVQNPAVVSREVATETIIMVPMQRHLNALIATASSVWAFLATARTVDEVVAHVTATFAVKDPAAVREDMVALLEDLEKKNLIVPAD